MIRTTLVILSTACLLFVPAHGYAQGSPAAQKKPGVVRIGIVKPKMQMAGGDAAQLSDSVSKMLADYLRGPKVEVALLASRMQSQYAIEAKEAGCDYMLSTSFTQQRGADGGTVGRALGALAGNMPYFGGGRGVADSFVARGVLQTAASMASSTKATDEMQVDYQLDAVSSSTSVLANTAKIRAKADGEDLLTPAVEKAAEAVGAALTKR